MFTVIIPTYNHADFLRRALRSVIDQTISNWECVIVDNHSADRTDEVVAGFGDRRLRLLKIHNHGVIAASRNFGIENAKGEWLAFLDSDDYWYPTKLEVVAAEIAGRKGLDVISADEWVVNQDSGDRSILRYGPYCEEFYRALLIEGNRLSTSATVIRRAFLEKAALRFRENKNFITVEDYDLWLRLAHAGATFSFLRSVEGEYSIHGGNSSANVERHYRNLKAMLYDHIFNVQDFSSNKEQLWRVVLARVLLGEAKAALDGGSLWNGVRLGSQAFVDAPLGVVEYMRARLRRRSELRSPYGSTDVNNFDSHRG